MRELLIFSVNFPICFMFVCFNRIRFSLGMCVCVSGGGCIFLVHIFWLRWNFPIALHLNRYVCLECIVFPWSCVDWIVCFSKFQCSFFIHIFGSLCFFSLFTVIPLPHVCVASLLPSDQQHTRTRKQQQKHTKKRTKMKIVTVNVLLLFIYRAKALNVYTAVADWY